MGLEITVDDESEEIGTEDFFDAFFFTIVGNLEPNGWGTKFPKLMNNIYQGCIKAEDANQALTELKEARDCLSRLPLINLIWDIDDPSLQPPWGTKVDPSIDRLSDYFLTSGGENLFDVLERSLKLLISKGGEAIIE